jgi:polyisoprenoid-binding protein YceI
MLSTRRPRTLPERLAPSPRRRRRRRWLVGVIVALAVVIVIVAAAAAFVVGQSAPAALRLPRDTPSAPVGTVNGSWRVTAGSIAGFRLPASVIGLSNDVVGRTTAVSGTVSIARGTVTSATFRIDLSSIRVSGKTEPGLAAALDTSAYPVATIRLGRSVGVGPALASGSPISSTASCYLAMRGITRAVTVRFEVRRSGTELQIAGSIPVLLADWGIRAPAGFGFLGSLAGHGIAEFLLVLRR